MLENLKRIRQPVTWAVLGVLVANMIIQVIKFGYLVIYEDGGVFESFQTVGISILPLALVLALIGLVCTCLFVTPASGRALTLAKLAAWVVTVGVVAQLICLLLGLASSVNGFAVVLEILGGLLDVILKAVAAGVLWVLHRGVDAGRIDMAAPAPARTPAEVEQVTDTPKAPPIWRRDQAAGAVWRTANEAASGAAPEGSAEPLYPTTDPEADGDTPVRLWKPVRRRGDESTIDPE
ncbi:MAG: hypothetical protein WAS07_11045 [Micropruina sp.]|nr:hypothetical protein [Micropruina sp.]